MMAPLSIPSLGGIGSKIGLKFPRALRRRVGCRGMRLASLKHPSDGARGSLEKRHIGGAEGARGALRCGPFLVP